jgi:hypothetical protein
VLSYPENHYVGNNIVINVTINNGFDVKTTWYVNNRLNFALQHPGKGVRVHSDSRRYGKGKLVIKVKASNLVSTVYDSIVIYNYYKIEGFGIHFSHGTLHKDVDFVLKLAGGRLPQGLIDYKIYFGDGDSNSGEVSSTDSRLRKNGLHFPKRYFREDTYVITVTLVSPIDSANLTSEIKIVEPIRSMTVSCL